MIALTWWALPAILWAALAVMCIAVGSFDVIGAEVAAGALFLFGSLICASLACGCHLLQA